MYMRFAVSNNDKYPADHEVPFKGDSINESQQTVKSLQSHCISLPITHCHQSITAKMRHACMLPFTQKQIITTGDYCEAYSSKLPTSILEQIHFTDKLSKDEVVMAPSLSQCSWLMGFTESLAPNRSRLRSFPKKEKKLKLF
jgi:hypothetical protein